MAWDTEETQQRLLRAAIKEFSSSGFAGARIDRISKLSGCNKERIYFYFGGKAQLFEAALTQQLVTALEGIAVTGSGPRAAGEFAGRYFDASLAQPDLARLTLWEGLERGSPVDAERRACRATRKVEDLREALPGADRKAVEELLLTIVTLCHGWVGSPNLISVITSDAGDVRRRQAVVRVAELLAADAVAPSA